ncbi:hypothetical protein HMPREF0620_0400 [Parascardovia denticolens DSM 10105 = JCM 12538]|uniref:Uncharacterized protein n=1 Tax=Parascardovia denticolens DSM 10105 = JCM 12538 TaxID=864564 RepID=E6K0R4_PARDN|nr:hypothetical protein HMPREF0620_0400 [Parascardovia denticolens DSM 10105 = JCM 12538]
MGWADEGVGLMDGRVGWVLIWANRVGINWIFNMVSIGFGCY